MKIEDIIDQARRYIQGKMQDEERTAFESLLDQEPELREEIDLMKAMADAMKELPGDKISERIARSKLQKPRSYLEGRWFWVGAVLLVLLLLFLLSKKYLIDKGTDTQDRFSDKAIVTFGSPSEGLQINSSTGMVVSSEGNLIICGNFYDQLEIGEFHIESNSGSQDIFIAELNATLEVQWVKSYGSEHMDIAHKIALDEQDNIYFTGTVGGVAHFDEVRIIPKGDLVRGQHGDLFIAKIDSSMEVKWVISDGGRMRPYVASGRGAISDLFAGEGGGIYATGTISGDSIFDQPIELTKSKNGFIIKLNGDGKIEWQRHLVGEYGVQILAGATKNGIITVCGYFGHPAYGGDIWYDGDRLPSYGGSDLFIAKYDTAGKFQWGAQGGSSTFSRIGEGDVANDLYLTYGNQILVTGIYTGEGRLGEIQLPKSSGRDMFLAELDPEGNYLWAATGNGSESPPEQSLNLGKAVVADRTGNIFVCGIFGSKTKFGSQTLEAKGPQDIFVARYDPDGNLVWIKQIGGEMDLRKGEFAQDLAISPEGDIYLTGFFSGELEIEGHRLSSGGKIDIFVLALTPNGDIKNFDQVLYAEAAPEQNVEPAF